MKILHTADWHIGKVLHKHSLSEEMEMFFQWLLQLIRDEEIDLLLISGDVFDVANPSVADRGVYYRYLSQLQATGIQVVITGGNHDSVGLLDAPQEILKFINISVIGGATEDLEDELIEIKNKEGEVELVVAAVPFLRDRDLRNLVSDQKFDSRELALKAGIEQHYQRLGELCMEKYNGVPSIAMGHLYAKGVSTSESERDIHIGNAAAIESTIFPASFDYIALGHIHRPQIVGGSEMIRYSGSPIALSFSEKKDEKCVLVLTLADGVLSKPEVILIPKKRDLLKISGDYDSVNTKLESYTGTFDLPSFVELEVLEEDFSAVTLANVDALVNEYSEGEHFKILKSKTHFANGSKNTADLFDHGTSIEDLHPSDVFEKRLKGENIDPEKRALINEAFLELVDEVRQLDK